MTRSNDWLTIGALGLLAMCVVTFDHEALGHGGACLLLHGRISLLTSSVFRCDLRSGWIDPAGPLSNLLVGGIALALSRLVPMRLVKLRLFLTLVGAFSWFWETAYLVQAMLKQDGDLYFFARFMLGAVSPWVRYATAAVGLALFLLTARIVSHGFTSIWPEKAAASAAARTAWAWAAAGATAAALLNANHDWADVKDAALEIGGASLPLLFVPLRGTAVNGERTPVVIARSPGLIGLAAAAYAVFAATLGRGLSL
jgi:hypothetical protein